MPYEFTLHRESLKRKFAVYVVVAKSVHNTKIYIGKTGDNNDGCNPVISRCGNHFSYNEMHSQVRNKLDDHESREYTYLFDHFDDYPLSKDERRICIDRINEMERWLIQEVHSALSSHRDVIFLNQYRGKGYVSAAEKTKRAAFRTSDCQRKISALATAVAAKCPPSDKLT